MIEGNAQRSPLIMEVVAVRMSDSADNNSPLQFVEEFVSD
jgi:hypothetical protein